jgi:hypothetical protein
LIGRVKDAKSGGREREKAAAKAERRMGKKVNEGIGRFKFSVA